MYTTEQSTTNDIMNLQYVFDRIMNYQWHKVLTVCIRQNYQQSMA